MHTLRTTAFYTHRIPLGAVNLAKPVKHQFLIPSHRRAPAAPPGAAAGSFHRCRLPDDETVSAISGRTHYPEVPLSARLWPTERRKPGRLTSGRAGGKGATEKKKKEGIKRTPERTTAAKKRSLRGRKEAAPVPRKIEPWAEPAVDLGRPDGRCPGFCRSKRNHGADAIAPRHYFKCARYGIYLGARCRYCRPRGDIA